MFKIEIIGAARSIGFTDKDTGEQRSFLVQEAALHTPQSKYPKLFEISVPKGKDPYAPGFYTLTADSIYVNRLGKLALTPRLVPEKPAKVA